MTRPIEGLMIYSVATSSMHAGTQTLHPSHRAAMAVQALLFACFYVAVTQLVVAADVVEPAVMVIPIK